MNRYDLTDFEWSVIEPLLPNRPRGVPRVDVDEQDRVVVHADLGCHRLVCQPDCAAQDHAAAIGERARDPAAVSLTLKIRPFYIAQNQNRHQPANATRHRKDLPSPTPMTSIICY